MKRANLIALTAAATFAAAYWLTRRTASSISSSASGLGLTGVRPR